MRAQEELEEFRQVRLPLAGMDVDENDDKLGLGKDCFGLIPLDRATLRVFGHTDCSNSPLG